MSVLRVLPAPVCALHMSCASAFKCTTGKLLQSGIDAERSNFHFQLMLVALGLYATTTVWPDFLRGPTDCGPSRNAVITI